MRLKHQLRKLLWKSGYDLVKFEPSYHSLPRRSILLSFYQIEMLLDVGANIGQFAMEIRDDLNFRHRIVSFEPLSGAYSQLKNNAQNDPNWQVMNYALGADNQEMEINIASNSYSSSILDMLPSHSQAAPDSTYIGSEKIEVKTLDSVFSELNPPQGNIFLKIDTQGFERQVLEGAEASLSRIKMIQLEMSLEPLYKGELLFNDMNAFLGGKGYTLVGLEPGFADPESGHLLQVDGIFRRDHNGN